ncbi:MAG: response regulator, partial [Armatimonadetes bacterium]|nr:response regulator [Armatimonadota bacterium]
TESCDGAETLEHLARETFDVILLDIMMPVLDGFEVLRRIRAERLNANTPVVVLTSRSQDADILKGYALGATLYITKPFEPEDLVGQVHQLLGLI